MSKVKFAVFVSLEWYIETLNYSKFRFDNQRSFIIRILRTLELVQMIVKSFHELAKLMSLCGFRTVSETVDHTARNLSNSSQ